jgi:hypothetical protein
MRETRNPRAEDVKMMMVTLTTPVIRKFAI